MKVTILTPVKNEEKFIGEAIRSVLSQTYTDFEFIIIDDGSTDKTVEIVKSFDDSRIKLIISEGKGKNIAYNIGYNESDGDFLCYFDGDDILEPDSIENRLEPIKHLKKPSATASKSIMFSEFKKFDGVITPKSNVKGTLIGASMMINRSLAERVFPLPEDLPNQDKWTVQHIYHFADLYHVPVITFNYRIHENNSSSRTNPFHLKTEAMHKRFLVYKKFLEKYYIELNDQQRLNLTTLAKAEELRYQNKTLSILFLKNLNFGEKARFVFHSTAFLYWLRIQLFSVLSGRT